MAFGDVLRRYDLFHLVCIVVAVFQSSLGYQEFILVIISYINENEQIFFSFCILRTEKTRQTKVINIEEFDVRENIGEV